MAPTLALIISLNLLLALLIFFSPPILRQPAARISIFVALFLLPSMVLVGGFNHHLEQAKTTDFCLSCHVMEPYGRSLFAEDSEQLPASHFQNRRIDREHACYTCHTTYTMFGDLRSKWHGAKHVMVNYLGTIPDQLALYSPYKNRECLHCHGGARSYTENELHADILTELEEDELSCLECHEIAHDRAGLENREMWKGEER